MASPKEILKSVTEYAERNRRVIRASDVGRGGNLILQAGSAGTLDPHDHSRVMLYSGSVIFQDPEGQETLRIQPDGSFIVRGTVVAEDLEVYRAFREWICSSRVHHSE